MRELRGTTFRPAGATEDPRPHRRTAVKCEFRPPAVSPAEPADPGFWPSSSGRPRSRDRRAALRVVPNANDRRGRTPSFRSSPRSTWSAALLEMARPIPWSSGNGASRIRGRRTSSPMLAALRGPTASRCRWERYLATFILADRRRQRDHAKLSIFRRSGSRSREFPRRKPPGGLLAAIPPLMPARPPGRDRPAGVPRPSSTCAERPPRTRRSRGQKIPRGATRSSVLVLARANRGTRDVLRGTPLPLSTSGKGKEETPTSAFGIGPATSASARALAELPAPACSSRSSSARLPDIEARPEEPTDGCDRTSWPGSNRLAGRGFHGPRKQGRRP